MFKERNYEKQTKRNYNESRDLELNKRKECFSRIMEKYSKQGFAKIDVLVDLASTKEDKMIDVIKENWSSLFDEDFDTELIKTYINLYKIGQLKINKGEYCSLINLEYVLLDTWIKLCIINAETVEELHKEKIFEGIKSNLKAIKDPEKNIEVILKKYLPKEADNRQFIGLKRIFKNYQIEIQQLYDKICENIRLRYELHDSMPNIAHEKVKEDEIRQRDTDNNEQVRLNKDSEENRLSKLEEEIELLKDRLNQYENSNKKMHIQIIELEQNIKSQKENLMCNFLEVLNSVNFGNVLDRLYLWAFKEKDYDIYEIKLYVKNLFRAFEDLGICVDDEILFKNINLKPHEIGTSYRLNKDIGEYVEGEKKVIFPAWKYREKTIINPMIEV